MLNTGFRHFYLKCCITIIVMAWICDSFKNKHLQALLIRLSIFAKFVLGEGREGSLLKEYVNSISGRLCIYPEAGKSMACYRWSYATPLTGILGCFLQAPASKGMWLCLFLVNFVFSYQNSTLLFL